MSLTTGQRQAGAGNVPSTAVANAEPSQEANRARSRRMAPAQTSRNASDDEILGLRPAAAADANADGSAGKDQSEADAKDGDVPTLTESQNTTLDLRTQAALDSNPELRRAWQDAQLYREAFATPEEARAATALLSDLDRIDALFFSRRPENHAELARAVANLDPVAFASLAKVMNDMAANGSDTPPPGAQAAAQPHGALAGPNPDLPVDRAKTQNATPAQFEFLHAANAAAVQGVLDTIQTQVDRLLPQGVSKTARNRVVGEIYRELDATLGSNQHLGQQMREAFRSGNLDAAHQRAMVALVTGRARQALPSIAKRVVNEWTSTVVAANQDRLARQRAAAHRVDIAGSGRGGDGGQRSLTPRDIDYARMSDSDILNL
jgi:hypothetical protein